MRIKSKSILILSLLTLMVTSNTTYAKETYNGNGINYSKSTSVDCFEEQVDYKIKTSGANVNLRTGPGTKYSVLTKIPNNSVVTKISDFSNGRWAKTVFVGNRGKEYIGYIKYDESYTSKAPKSNTSLGEITANRVVFRNGDSTKSGKLGYFYKGNTIEILQKAKNGYYKIKVINTDGKYKDNIGYVHSDYVSIK